jgi:hypothetical protein
MSALARRARIGSTNVMRIAIHSVTTLLALSLTVTACSGGSDHDADAASTDARLTDASMDDGTDPNDFDGYQTGDTARDFTLLGRNTMTQAGHAVGAYVVETTGGREMGFVWNTAIDGNMLELRLPDLVPEGDYRADVFVDVNGNGRYDGPATDPSWSVMLPEQGSATASFDTTSPTVDLASVMRTPRGDFTAMLSGFTSDETGHWFELRVIDPSTRATVGGYTNPSLPSGVVQITLPGILDEGTTYDVDFWVDMDGSNTYTGVPNDHAWRTSTQGTSVTWTRDDSFTEVDWR